MAASATYSALKTSLDGQIYKNSSNAIDGDDMNDALDEIIDTVEALSESKMPIATSIASPLVDNTYYKISSEVGTQTFTLPTISDATRLHKVMISFTTSSSPSITISGGSGVTVEYNENFALEASTTYEVNCLWNGTKWIVTAFAYGSLS